MLNSMYRILSLFLLLNSYCFAQQFSKECFDKDGNLVEEKDSEYCVVGKKVLRIDELEGGETDTVESYIDTVNAYYSGINKMKFLKIYSKNGFLNGNFIEYFTNGKTKERGSYSEGRKLGYVVSYYPEGKTKSTLQYFSEKDQISEWGETDFKIINYWDSTRKQIVVGGNGYCNCILVSGRNEIGKVVDGLRDSVWVEYSKDTLILRESYARGKLIEGIRYYKGKEYRYKNFDEPPEFIGGAEKMNKSVFKNFKYPADAMREGIQGTVYISFTVNGDGTARDFEIVHGINGSCDQEALRVVSLLKNWTPGTQRGKPVNVKFVYPLKLKLDY